MAITDTDWEVTRASGNIRYIGDGHGGALPSYATVIEFHRWLQGLADDAVAIGDDELDITNTDPSRRSTDNIITLINNYNITATEAEHLYDGSVIYGDGDEIYDGIVNFGNVAVQIQVIQDGAVISNDFWNYTEGGTDDTSTNAAFLTDTTKSAVWTTDEWVGYILYNTTDGSSGVITANTTTTITATLDGGTENDWDSGEAYLIGQGLNADATAGISHRFMVKTRTGGSDLDGGRLVGTCRRYGFTYSEFKINGTARGNNVLALSDSSDLNNESTMADVSTWTGITNTTEGYSNLDVDNNGTDEYYYSEWNTNQPTRSINDFYERMKWLTRDATASTLYGLSGELFRGITHEVAITSGTGTWAGAEELTWGTGVTAGVGQLFAVDNTAGGSATALWMQLLSGVVPASVTITGTSSSATAVVGATPNTARSITTPFVGNSTGSALIGAYGVGVEVLDLAATDKVTDLGGNVITPPNNVTNTVSGLIHDEDRVLVAPWDGTSYDTNGDPAIDKNQLTLATILNADNITQVDVTASTIPSDTPSTGYIRVTDNNGFERRLHYTEWVQSTPDYFTIDTTDGNEDFASVNASATNDVYVAYIDEIAEGATVTAINGVNDTVYVIKTTGTTDFTTFGATDSNPGTIFTFANSPGTGTGDMYEQSTNATYTSVQSGSRNLVVIVRDGATTPIKQFISSWSQTTSGQTINAIRTTDA